MSTPLPATSYNFSLEAAALAGTGSPYLAIVVYNRDPTTTDTAGPSGAYMPGQIWFSKSSLNWWGLSSIVAGSASWIVISYSSGEISAINGTTNQVTVATTNGVAVVSLPSPLTAPGNITATGSITANSGNVAILAGNLNLNAPDGKILINATAPATASVGTSSALVSGLVTVSTTAVTANSKIFLTYALHGDEEGDLSSGNIVPGVSFDIISDNDADSAIVNYLIIN